VCVFRPPLRASVGRVVRAPQVPGDVVASFPGGLCGAGRGPGLSRAAFISGALRVLSVALCRGNASLCRSGAYVATRAAGRAPMGGLAQPSAEVVQACLLPRVWVWVSGSAPLCVA
jgi:hypothetical protein